jgi:hypothetical protein
MRTHVGRRKRTNTRKPTAHRQANHQENTKQSRGGMVNTKKSSKRKHSSESALLPSTNVSAPPWPSGATTNQVRHHSSSCLPSCIKMGGVVCVCCVCCVMDNNQPNQLEEEQRNETQRLNNKFINKEALFPSAKGVWVGGGVLRDARPLSASPLNRHVFPLDRSVAPSQNARSPPPPQTRSQKTPL